MTKDAHKKYQKNAISGLGLSIFKNRRRKKKPGAFFRQILTQSAMHVRLFGMIIQISFPSKFRMPSPLSGLPHLYMVYKVTNYHLVI